MRLLAEGKRDFRLSGKALFFFLLFLAVQTEAQISINGLCRYGVYETEPGFKTLQTLNYNNDYYTDFAVFSGDNNKILTLAGSERGSQPKKVFSGVPHQIEKMYSITDYNNNVEGYLYISRKSRRAGLINFSKSGKASTGASVKFSSYPSNVSIADVDGDSQKEILVSGESFKGLEILKRNKGRLERKEIIREGIFPQAVFIDLNSDGYADIVAYNLLENKLELYFNNSQGGYSLTRQIQVSEKFHYLYSYDVNSDTYSDILFSSGRNLHFLLGDSVASYKREVKIPIKYEADKFIPGDFNRDGLVDITYINMGNSVVSTLFQKDELDFSGELAYLEKENLTDVIPYYSRFVEGFAALSSSGKIYTITRESFLTQNTSIKLYGDADVIIPFEYSSSSFADICYLDTTKRSFNIVLRKEDHTPGIFFSTPVNSIYKNIEAETVNKNEVIFYLYTKNERIIEAVAVNFLNYTISREFIQCRGNIRRVNLHRGNANEYPELRVFHDTGTNQFVSVYNRKTRYINVLDKEIKPRSLDVQTEGGEVYSWIRGRDGTGLHKSMLVKENEKKELISLSDKYIYKTSLMYDALNKGEDRLVSFFETEQALFLLILPGEKGKRKTSSMKQIKPRVFADKKKEIQGEESIFDNAFTGKINHGFASKLYLYSGLKKTLYRLDLTRNGTNVNFTPVTEIENLGSYFVENRLRNSTYVIYADRQEKCIRTKKI